MIRQRKMKHQQLILLLYLLALCSSLTQANPGAARQDTTGSNTSPLQQISPLSLGAGFFTGYLIKEVYNLLKRANRPHMTDYFDCGRRNESTLTNQAFRCDDTCTFSPGSDATFGSIQEFNITVGTLYNLTINNLVANNLVPDNYSCLDTCDFSAAEFDEYELQYIQGTNLGLSCAESYYLVYAQQEGETNSSVWVPQSVQEKVFIYCIKEQYELNPSWTLASPPAESKSRACNNILCFDNSGIYRRKTTFKAKKGRRKKFRTRSRQTPSSTVGLEDVDVYPTQSPWLCSLRFRGLDGQHRCGVTLLSGPPNETILVSAAHCNYICKDMPSGEVLDVCCCRKSQSPGSCSGGLSKFCGRNPQVVPADPFDLQIVCGIYSLEVVPEYLTFQDETVLDISEIIIHPDYTPEQPAEGYDIAVYKILNPDRLIGPLGRGTIIPACLPKTNYDYYELVAWVAPEPTFRNPTVDVINYVNNNFFPKTVLMVPAASCLDPVYMGSNTYHPPGVKCFTDRELLNCVTFGNSGSSVMGRSTDLDGTVPRYSFIGPLSFSKGCDRSRISSVFRNSLRTTVKKFSLAGENTAVFTDGECYLDWIADQYNLNPPDGYVRPSRCSISTGDPNDKDKRVCRTSLSTLCDFSVANFSQCQLQVNQGYTYNVFQCIDTNGVAANCANNCVGVDPNAIVVGGIVAGTVAGAAGLGPLVPGLLGVGGLGLTGVAAMMMMNNNQQNCGPGECRTPSGSCCDLIQLGDRFVCPRFC